MNLSGEGYWKKTTLFTGPGPLFVDGVRRNNKQRVFFEAKCGKGLIVITRGFELEDQDWHIYIYDIRNRTVYHVGSAREREAAFSDMLAAAHGEKELLGGKPPVYCGRNVVKTEVGATPECVKLGLWQEPKPPPIQKFSWRKRFGKDSPPQVKCPECENFETWQHGWGTEIIIKAYVLRDCAFAVHICQDCKGEGGGGIFFTSTRPRDKGTPGVRALSSPLSGPGGKNSLLVAPV